MKKIRWKNAAGWFLILLLLMPRALTASAGEGRLPETGAEGNAHTEGTEEVTVPEEPADPAGEPVRTEDKPQKENGGTSAPESAREKDGDPSDARDGSVSGGEQTDAGAYGEETAAGADVREKGTGTGEEETAAGAAGEVTDAGTDGEATAAGAEDKEKSTGTDREGTEGPADGTEPDSETTSVESYLLQHLRADLTGRTEALTEADILTVKQTLVDEKELKAGETIDSLMTSDRLFRALITMLVTEVMVYDPGEESPYFVAHADTMWMDGGSRVIDAAFAHNNKNGEKAAGCIYDPASGIAYIPKKECEGPDGTRLIGYLQCQLLQAVRTSSSLSSGVPVRSTGDITSAAEGSENIFSMTTTVPVGNAGETKDLRKKDLAVLVNGIPLRGSDYSFDPGSGCVSIPLSSASVGEIDVVVDEPSAVSKIISALLPLTVHADLTPAEMDFISQNGVIEVEEDVKNRLYKGTIGVYYHMRETAAELSGLGDGYTYHPGTTYEAYAEAKQDLVDQIADGNAPSYAGNGSAAVYTAQRDAHNFELDLRGRTLTSGDSAMNFSSVKETLYMECSHITNPLFSAAGNSLEATYGTVEQKAAVRVLYIEPGKTWALFGIVSQPQSVTSVQQSGYGIFKAKIRVKPSYGYLHLKKVSNDPAVTEGNPMYGFASARYGVFEDAACTKYAKKENGENAAHTIQADGMTGAPLSLEPGTYYIKEIRAPQGYLLSPAVYKAVIEAGKTATVTVREDAAVSAADFLIQKVDAETGGTPAAEGDGVFAEFRVRYYASYEDPLPDRWEREWILRTKAGDDALEARLDPSFLETGSAFYEDGGGQTVLPLGTVTIEEITPPENYEAETGILRGTVSMKDGTAVLSFEEEEDGTVTFRNRHTEVIRTEARDRKSGTRNAFAGEGAEIVDSVSYEHLKPGHAYEIRGVLCDAANGEAFLWNGERVTASFHLPWDEEREPAGTAELVFGPFDASSLAGKTLVVYESLYDVTDGERLAASHADPDTISQRIAFPRIGTTAADRDTGTGRSLAAGERILTDTVVYENLIPGLEYTLTGKGIDTKTGEPVKAGGEPVTASSAFTPESSSGTAEVVFGPYDGADLSGKKIVFYETLSCGGTAVASHADPGSEPQTVTFPGIATSAEADGKKSAAAEKETVIRDTVTYTNLEKGKTYTLKGTLVDKKTGKAFAGEGASASAYFTPEEENGKTVLSFTVDARPLAGRSVVVFEELYDGEKMIAYHRDPESADQTVTFLKDTSAGTKRKTAIRKAASPLTGDPGAQILLGAGAALAAVCVFLIRKKYGK